MPEEEMLPPANPPMPFLKKEHLEMGKQTEFTVVKAPYLKKATKEGFKDQIVVPSQHKDGRVFLIPLNYDGQENLYEVFGRVPSKWVGKTFKVGIDIVKAGNQKGKPTFTFEAGK